MPWVETNLVLRELGGDRKQYRHYVEAGKGERLISPFERAIAGMVLGTEEFAKRIGKMVKGREDHGDQPALKALRRACLADPDTVEELVERLFSDSGRARRKRLQLLALRKFSMLRPSEIARRHDRRPSAVTMAVNVLEAEAKRDPGLRARLGRLERAVEQENEK